MPRPRDLPQPVRPHDAHGGNGLFVRGADSPGPAAYRVAGSSFAPTHASISAAAHGVSFTKSKRFGPGAGGAASLLSPASESPGPCYVPAVRDTRLAVSFKGGRIRRNVDNEKDLTPGPGTYDLQSAGTVDNPFKTPFAASSSGVTIPKSERPNIIAGGSEALPGPDAYAPRKPPTLRKGAAFFGTSQRGGIFEAATEMSDLQKSGFTPLEAMDRGMSVTRHPTAAAVQFSRAERTSALGRSNDGGAPDALLYRASDTWIRPNSRGASFGSAQRTRPASAALRGASAGTLYLPANAVASTKCAAPAVGFTRAKRTTSIGGPSRGPAREDSAGISGAMPLRVSYQQIDANVKLCVGWRQPTNRLAHQPDVAAPPYSDPASSISPSTGVSFPKAKRPDVLAARAGDIMPGPGAYTPQLRRPDSARQSIGRAPRNTSMNSHDVDDGAPSLLHAPIDLVRPSAPAVSIARPTTAPARRPDAAPEPGSYNPSYHYIERQAPAAVLYLTG